MRSTRFNRFALVSILGATLSACASGSNAFDRHDRMISKERAEVASADRGVCPVVVSNATDQQMDAVYQVRGVESMLGLIPAGRSLAFGVSCDAGAIEAFAVSDVGGLLGGAEEYRTMSSLDKTGATRMSFTVADRVR